MVITRLTWRLGAWIIAAPLIAPALAQEAYVTVDRPGSERRMVADADLLAAAAAGVAPPVGSTITMTSGDLVFYLRRGVDGWRYGTVIAGRPLGPGGDDRSCAFCHARAADRGGVFTWPSLVRRAAGGAPERITCTETGRTPCAPATYEASTGGPAPGHSPPR